MNDNANSSVLGLMTMLLQIMFFPKKTFLEKHFENGFFPQDMECTFTLTGLRYSLALL